MTLTRAKTLAALAGTSMLLAISSAHAGIVAIEIEAAEAVYTGDALAISATVTDDGAPVAGSDVTFDLGGLTAEATTDDDGVATASIQASLDGGTVALTATTVDASASVDVDVLRRPVSFEFLRPDHLELGEKTDVQAVLIDDIHGGRVSGTRLDCTQPPANPVCKIVLDPLTATFTLGTQAGVAATTGTLGSPPSTPATDTVFTGKITPNESSLGQGTSLQLDFAGTPRLEPTSTSLTVDVWEHVMHDETGGGMLLANPTRDEFRVLVPGYDSGVVTEAGFTAAGPAFAIVFDGTDAHGAELRLAGALRNVQPATAAFVGLGGMTPITVISRSH